VTVSIIIPTIHANPEMLAGCVEGVLETTGQKPVVVSGGSFAGNCNTGAQGSAAEVFVFLNDDCELLSGWLPPLLAAFDDKNVGIAGSKLVYPDGRLQHAGVSFRHRNGKLEAFNITDCDPPSRVVEAVTGACMAVRRECWEQIGGFDPEYVNGYEDVDLCLRAQTEGWQIRYVAESVVVHLESQSGHARWTHVRENIALLQERWA
jgi:GT2 family glycosyltransferase